MKARRSKEYERAYTLAFEDVFLVTFYHICCSIECSVISLVLNMITNDNQVKEKIINKMNT